MLRRTRLTPLLGLVALGAQYQKKALDQTLRHLAPRRWQLVQIGTTGEPLPRPPLGLHTPD